MIFQAKLRKVGQDSLAITIPKPVVEALKLEEDVVREFDIKENKGG